MYGTTSPTTSRARWRANPTRSGTCRHRAQQRRSLLLGIAAIAYTIATGIGTWGLNRTVGWAFDITNFVFWVGIGHAGTLISAVLFLFRQRWRTAVNRSAEAMTIFAVMCAALFPLIHMGRPWLAFWPLPYPNTRGSLWINWRSPLFWDVIAISTYFIISATFWYVGLIPTSRRCATANAPFGRSRSSGSSASAGTGPRGHWQRYEVVYLLLAGLATPLVFSVHTIVSFDFATSVIPGWHTTIFPPYFVAGAIFSGLSMVLTLMLVARRVMRLENYITASHVGRDVQAHHRDGRHRRPRVRHRVLHGLVLGQRRTSASCS